VETTRESVTDRLRGSENELDDELWACRRLDAARRARSIKLGQFESRPLKRQPKVVEQREQGRGRGRGCRREMDPWGVSLPLTRPEANWPESRVAFPSSGSGIMADLHVNREANSRGRRDGRANTPLERVPSSLPREFVPISGTTL